MEFPLSVLVVVLDILIVSYIIYKLLMLLRGTRAIQLIKGIMIVIIAWLLSAFFELKTLQWLMSQTFTYGVLAIIIIFQPELRRALEKLGSGSFFKSAYATKENETAIMINKIIDAVFYFSKRKIGALIVMERMIGLDEYKETGTVLNADLSSEMLINIFMLNAPLHDGAVIIRNGKILSAASYLPLTQSPYVSKELGSRHRAAIGISEVSDAITIIASEETGTVSVTIDGKIIRGLNEDSLRQLLLSELSEESSTKYYKFWRKRWKKNG